MHEHHGEVLCGDLGVYGIKERGDFVGRGKPLRILWQFRRRGGAFNGCFRRFCGGFCGRFRRRLQSGFYRRGRSGRGGCAGAECKRGAKHQKHHGKRFLAKVSFVVFHLYSSCARHGALSLRGTA